MGIFTPLLFDIMNKNIIIFFVVVFLCFLSFFFFKKEKDIVISDDVNIVFTTDNNYKEPLKTALYSLIKNKNPDTVYNINILCVDFETKDLSIYDKYNSKTVHIKSIPLKLSDISDVGDYDVNFHVTRADLFKFFMPQIFPELDKILYLDVDILVLGDLSDLYNTDLKNKYIAAVHNSNSKQSYNCGVLLYNLKQWRRHNLTNKLIKSKNKDELRTLMTQNAFNDVIKPNKIYYLPHVYNVWANADESAFEYYIKDSFNFENTEIKTVDDYLKSAVILHYYVNKKPWHDYWNFFENKYVNLWKKYDKERLQNESK